MHMIDLATAFSTINFSLCSTHSLSLECSMENGEVDQRGDWVVPATRQSHVCINPVRSCVEDGYTEALKEAQKNADKKSLLKLSIGDPTVFGLFPPPQAAYDAVQAAMESGEYNGYAHSSGLQKAREAVAMEYGKPPEPSLQPEDVIMTHSGSGALLMALEVLCEPGTSVLIPTPGFGLYQCHAAACGVTPKHYRLLPERGWEVDLDYLEQQIDDTVRALVINNPSNPCGSVYSEAHLLAILALAERHRLPIISDSIYHKMVFKEQKYVSLASLSKNVPILSCGGISKRYMVPGWRMGWILIHDRNRAFEKEVRPGLARLAMKLLGPCTLVQAALPRLFKETPESYHTRNMEVFATGAKEVYRGLQVAPGITPIMPGGSMYFMVLIDLKRFPEFASDVEFTKQLLREEGVFCLPGKSFMATGCFRIVLIMPVDRINEACKRITEFCQHHYK